MVDGTCILKVVFVAGTLFWCNLHHKGYITGLQQPLGIKVHTSMDLLLCLWVHFGKCFVDLWEGKGPRGSRVPPPCQALC